MSQSGKNYKNEDEKYRKNIGNFRNLQNDKYVNYFYFQIQSTNSRESKQIENSRIFKNKDAEKQIYKRHYFILFLFFVFGCLLVFFLLNLVHSKNNVM